MVKVRVNVYDLSHVNRVFRFSKLGVYHTSVVIGEEFEIYYGYLSYSICGIDYAEEIDKLPSSMSGNLYSTYNMGNSELSLDEIRKKCKQFSKRAEWLSNRYNVLCHNCNTFSYSLCSEILIKRNMEHFPEFVFRSQRVIKPVFEILSPIIDENKTPFYLNKHYAKDEILEKE